MVSPRAARSACLEGGEEAEAGAHRGAQAFHGEVELGSVVVRLRGDRGHPYRLRAAPQQLRSAQAIARQAQSFKLAEQWFGAALGSEPLQYPGTRGLSAART